MFRPVTDLSTRHTVVVRFKGVGNAPIMKQNVYKIIATNRFQAVIQFLRKELGWPKGEPLVGHQILNCLDYVSINHGFVSFYTSTRRFRLPPMIPC